MKKRIFVLAAISALSVGVFAGCGQKSPDDPVQIQMQEGDMSVSEVEPDSEANDDLSANDENITYLTDDEDDVGAMGHAGEEPDTFSADGEQQSGRD